MTNPVAGRYAVAYNSSVGERVRGSVLTVDGVALVTGCDYAALAAEIGVEECAAFVRARQLLLDRLTRRMVLVAHGVEAGGWSETPIRVIGRVVEASSG